MTRCHTVLGIVLAAWSVAVMGADTAPTNPPASTPAVTSSVPESVDDMLPTGRGAARTAQRLMRVRDYDGAARLYLRAAQGVTGRFNRHCRYNAAAALYRAGRYTEAAALLSQLLHADGDTTPETAMGLGSAIYEAAEQSAPTNAAGIRRQTTRLKQAGEAFKEAARLDRENTTAVRNLAVILNRLPEAREQAKIAELMEQHGSTPPPELAERMVTEQRALLEAIPPAFTNEAPRRIATLESLAQRQSANADLLIPLKAGILSALQSAQGQPGAQQAVEQILENTRDSMHASAQHLRDLDPQGYEPAVLSEAGLYYMWKALASYGALLREDLRRQTNVITTTLDVPADRPAPVPDVEREQTEAASLTDLFTQRFTQQVPEEGLPAQPAQAPTSAPGAAPGDEPPIASTNAVGGLSAETRQEILELAAAAGEAQRAALDLWQNDKRDDSLDRQRRAHDLLKDIEKRLPKDQSSSQQQQQDSQDPSQQQEPQPDDASQDQQPQDDSQQEPPPPEPEESPPEEPSEEQPEPSETDEQPLSEEDLQRLLDKALQREQEHREEKRRRDQTIPMSPRERDW